jgi:predicted nucleic acid-binding protein
MTVYVESNFVLAIALGQEDADDAERLLKMAEEDRVDLALSSFALSEPYATVTQRGRARRRVITSINEQVRELARSSLHLEVVAALRPIALALANVERSEMEMLETTVRRLLHSGRSIEVDLSVFEQSLVLERRHGLSPQDAVILATVLANLTRRSTDGRAIFVGKNRRDFGAPGVVGELRNLGCRYVDDFATALELLAG